MSYYDSAPCRIRILKWETPEKERGIGHSADGAREALTGEVALGGLGWSPASNSEGGRESSPDGIRGGGPLN